MRKCGGNQSAPMGTSHSARVGRTLQTSQMASASFLPDPKIYGMGIARVNLHGFIPSGSDFRYSRQYGTESPFLCRDRVTLKLRMSPGNKVVVLDGDPMSSDPSCL